MSFWPKEKVSYAVGIWLKRQGCLKMPIHVLPGKGTVELNFPSLFHYQIWHILHLGCAPCSILESSSRHPVSGKIWIRLWFLGHFSSSLVLKMICHGKISIGVGWVEGFGGLESGIALVWEKRSSWLICDLEHCSHQRIPSTKSWTWQRLMHQMHCVINISWAF